MLVARKIANIYPIMPRLDKKVFSPSHDRARRTNKAGLEPTTFGAENQRAAIAPLILIDAGKEIRKNM